MIENIIVVGVIMWFVFCAWLGVRFGKAIRKPNSEHAAEAWETIKRRNKRVLKWYGLSR